METVPQASEEKPFPQVRAGLPAAAPLHWIGRAAEDLRACPWPSLFYGLCFAGMGALINLVFVHHYEYVSALVSGFLLVGPYLAIGLYEIARRRGQGAACKLVPTLAAWRSNAGNIGVFSLILTVIFLVWARASLVTFALFYTSDMPTLHGFLQQVVSLRNIDFLAIYFAVGVVFATLVFATSVVAIPMMLGRDQDAVTAILASFLALGRNGAAMLVWALLIVALTAIGFATFYVGLILTVPLVGLATWHAYEEVVLP